MTPCLVGHDLQVSYGERPVLRGASAVVVQGRTTVLLGPSGSGKTTLLWVLAGLLAPRGGKRFLADGPDAASAAKDGQELPPGRVTPQVGMVFQQPGLWDHLSAQDHLELVLSGKGLSRRQRKDRVDAVLTSLALEPLRRRRPGQMSGGERQRLAIARALVIQPRWLLLDEPLAHLDGSAREELLRMLREALAGLVCGGAAGGEGRAGVLMSTHQAEEGLRLADEVIILVEGAVAQSGPPQEVYRNPVSLQSALVLGPASELAGQVRQGCLWHDGQILMENLNGQPPGPARLILRPEDLQFLPAPAGPWRAERCEWCAGACRLIVSSAAGQIRRGEHLAGQVTVRHCGPVSLGQTGRLRRI